MIEELQIASLAAAWTGTVANVPMTISEKVETSVRKGPGWTVAQVKRMARKSRNKARNKAAHKGK